MLNPNKMKIKVQCRRTMKLTLMKTLRPAMLYRPSPTFFTFSLLHLVEGHWQWRWATLVTCWTCVTKQRKNDTFHKTPHSPWHLYVLQMTQQVLI